MHRLESSIEMLQEKIKVYDETVNNLVGLVDASTGGAARNILQSFAVKMNAIGHNHVIIEEKGMKDEKTNE